MKMKIFALFFVVVLVCSGCNINTQGNNNSPTPTSEVSEINFADTKTENVLLIIYDIDGNPIGEFEHYGVISQTEDSIIYSKVLNTNEDNIAGMGYYRYFFDSKESIYLGTVERWSYEASYATTFLNSHLYMLITTDMDKGNDRILKLYDIDLKSNKMSEISSEKGGFPYNTMTAAGDKLLIARVLTNGSHLEEYNPETKVTNILKRFEFNDSANVGEAIRQVTADKDTISLLILKIDPDDKVSLRTDVYDYDMSLLRSIDLSSISDSDNELRQGVSHFMVSDKYVYYENFSSTRFLGKLKGDKLEQVLSTNLNFEMASNIFSSDDTKVFYQSFGEENDVILLDIRNNEMKKTVFNDSDERYYIVFASKSNDKLLFTLAYKDPDTGEVLPTKLYYVNISDLNFKKNSLQ